MDYIFEKTLNKIIIREAVAEDAEKLLEHMRRVGSESDNLSYGAAGPSLSVEEEAEFLRATRLDRRSIMLIAWKNNEIVGSANLKAFSRRMSHRAELGITVKRSEWNRGIGSALLERIVEFAGGADIEIISLEVRSDNQNAIHLYKKFGFKNMGKFPAFFKIADVYHDCELMYLDLRQ